MSDEQNSTMTTEEAQKHEEQFMEGLGEGQQQEQPKLAGKFNSAEELEKAYKELEKKLGQPKEKAEEKTQEEVKVPDDATATLGKKEEPVVEEAGPTLDEYLVELARTGTEIIDEIREDMQTRYNISDKTAQTLIDSAAKLYRADVENIITIAGGQEAFDAMNEFVVSKYSETEIEALNFSISNPATREFTIKGLLAQANAHAQSDETVESKATNVSTNGGLQPFYTDKEFQEAMADPRYSNAGHPDHKRYTEEVLQRYALSTKYIG